MLDQYNILVRRLKVAIIEVSDKTTFRPGVHEPALKHIAGEARRLHGLFPKLEFDP